MEQSEASKGLERVIRHPLAIWVQGFLYGFGAGVAAGSLWGIWR